MQSTTTSTGQPCLPIFEGEGEDEHDDDDANDVPFRFQQTIDRCSPEHGTRGETSRENGVVAFRRHSYIPAILPFLLHNPIVVTGDNNPPRERNSPTHSCTLHCSTRLHDRKRCCSIFGPSRDRRSCGQRVRSTGFLGLSPPPRSVRLPSSPLP